MGLYLKNIVYVLLLIAAASLQSTAALAVFSVKANLILAFLISAGFFIKKQPSYIFLAFLGSLLVPLQPGFRQEFFLLLFIALASYYAQRNFIANQLTTLILLIVISTLLWYIFLSPALILSAVFFLELILNILASLFFLYLFSLLKHE